MTTYGLWAEKIYFDEKQFRADLVDEHYTNKTGFKKIYAIDGLPTRFENDLIRSSQVSNVPHTWRVKECQLENEVTEEILNQGKSVLNADMKDLGAHVMTYVGQLNSSQDNTYQFLAAGAVRNKLTRDYQDNQYPVVSRAIVAPMHRGKGLGSLIVRHRIKAILNQYFGTMPKAIHFGTESNKILNAIKKIEQEEGLKFVYIGDEKYKAADGTHAVHDYLCFLPWFRAKLLDACSYVAKYTDTLQIVENFKKKLNRFMEDGIEGVSGTELETLYEEVLKSLQSQKENQEEVKKVFELIEEVFVIKKKIGACDP